MKLVFDFSPAQKMSMLRILDKYPVASSHHSEIRECLQVDGSTVLWPDEALYLAGIVEPYYSFLGQRLRNHPGIIAD